MACQVCLVLDRCLVFSQALVNLHQLNNGKQLVDVLHQQGDIPGHQSGLQFAVGNLLEPAVMGRTLNLSPLMILLSLSFWGMLWGIPGMFLSVPMMVMLAIACSQVEGLRWIAVVLSADGHIADAEPAADA